MTGRTPSEAEWLRVNAYCQRERHELAVRAAAGYPPGLRLAGTPLLAPPAWRLPAPVPLDGVRLEFRPDAPRPDVPDLAALVPVALPARADGSRYRRFSDVIAELAAPSVFENRPTYRLIEADLAGPDGPRLAFGRGRFFDSVDTGGAAAHAYAAARLAEAAASHEYPGAPSAETAATHEYPAAPSAETATHEYTAAQFAEAAATEPTVVGTLAGACIATPCAYRAALGGPTGLARRAAALAVSALTLRHDRRAGTATFPLHYREPGKVSHAAGLYQVIPVGVFQPSGEAPWNEANDFSLWRGLLREYAEELLGADEEYGSELAPIDWAWPLARAMTDGLADGRVRAWCLGLGADPLTFAIDLLAVVVIDAPLYDDLFGDMVDANAEGRVTAPRPFDRRSVSALLRDAPLQAAAEALLSLALEQRGTLLG